MRIMRSVFPQSRLLSPLDAESVQLRDHCVSALSIVLYLHLLSAKFPIEASFREDANAGVSNPGGNPHFQSLTKYHKRNFRAFSPCAKHESRNNNNMPILFL